MKATLCAAGATAAALLGMSHPSEASGAGCVARVERSAGPAVLTLGQAVTVTTRLALECEGQAPARAAAFVLDRSSSMDRGHAIEHAREAALLLSQTLRPGVDWATVIAFEDAPRIEQHLTDQPALVRKAIAGIETGGGTNIAGALAEARRQLARLDARRYQPMMVLLTDGKNQGGPEPVLREADALRRAGILVAVVGLGRDPERDVLRRVATAPSEAHFPVEPSELPSIFDAVARRWASIRRRDAGFEDRLPPGVAFETAWPEPDAILGPDLVWRLPALGDEVVVMEQRLTPSRAGRQPLSEGASLSWPRPGGGRDRADLPIPWVTVLEPGEARAMTATAAAIRPTPTAAPAGTGAPEPTVTAGLPPGATPSMIPLPTPILTPASPHPSGAIYLPLSLARACPDRPSPTPLDLVFVLDSSATMGLPTGLGVSRIEAARRAILSLVAGADPRGLRLGLVTFDARPRVIAPLAAQNVGLGAALAGIALGSGSRIDLGLLAGAALLEAGGEVPGGRRIVALVSDGMPTGVGPDTVLAVADRLRAGGVELAAVTLDSGDGAARALLRSVASGGLVLDAGDGSALAVAFLDLAAHGSCPAP